MTLTMRARCVLLSASALGCGIATPALAQEAAGTGNDIIVTAQRVEQRLQDVPISITVLDQKTLANNNISNAKDLAAFTPGLAVNNRYGADNTVFTIRGFYQEQRSFATVGVFFNDVVAPRGSGATFGGDGAGPGSLFDLQNVQVLKGPQGTLFGRNVTGGAVLLVPKRPTGKLEGYVEASAGDYGMYRVQGVVNVPLNDTFRVRLGVDHQQRNGYLQNIGKFGDGSQGNHGMGDVNYWAGRLGILAELTPDLENYTLASYSTSKSNGVEPKIIAAFAPASNATCAARATTANFGCESIAQMAREAATGNWWTVSNRMPDAMSASKQWQVINTTTWTASDTLTVKNIASYAEFRGKTNLDLFGNYALLPNVVAGTETPSQVNGFAFTHNNGVTGYTNAESSFVEELQIQGHSADNKLTWQSGGYMEINNPLGFSGVQTASFTPCTDIVAFACAPITTGQGVGGTGSYSLQQTKFRDYALYAQSTYKLTDTISFTAGARYTWDKMRTLLINETSLFNAVPANVTFACTNLTAPGFIAPINGFDPRPANTNNANISYANRLNSCQQNLKSSSHAPTWLLDLDWKPVDGVLIYGKWSRGYRQGGLAIFGPDPAQKYGPEKVDTFEIGTKTSWHGSMPGSFNMAGYYNNFRNQQLQLGVSCVPTLPNYVGGCAGNATIINAGKSRIWGFEAELNVSPFKGLKLNLAYAYINAKQLEVTIPAVPAPYNAFTAPLVNSGGKSCAGEMCDTIANSGPPHQLVLGGEYTLPLDQSVGKISFGASMTYQSRRRIVSDGVIKRADGSVLSLAQTAADGTVTTSGAGVAPSSTVLNLNATWESVARMPIDVSFFMTNVTNAHVILQINENTTRGFVSALIGEPRMFGGRIKYHF
ncbi:MAG: TonB-dependent receptor [Sphingomonadales bacterium]|nr:TonB-dependent receptor [Sphingomonadales bacterium]